MPARSDVWLLVFVLLPAGVGVAGAGATVRSIQVEGNRAFGSRDILSWMRTKPGQRLRPDVLERDVRAVLDHYKSAGYWLVAARTLQSAANQGVSLSIQIVEGPLCLLERVKVTGNVALDSTGVLGLMQTQPGQVLAQASLEADVDALIRWYENHGHPFCTVRIADLSVHDDGRVRLWLSIDEGPRVDVDLIDIVGNSITRDHVILRELGIQPGDPYDQSRVDAGYGRLLRLDFLEQVDKPEIQLDLPTGRGVLKVRVKEGRPNRASGAVGYVPDTGLSEAHFTGQFELALRNLWGSGRRLDASWRRSSPDASELSLAYEEPWILGWPVNLGLAFHHRQRQRYALTELRALLSAPFSDHLSANGSLGWERSVPDSVGSYLMPRTRAGTAQLQITYDTRDNPFNPRSGLHYRTSAELALKRNRATQGFVPEKRKARRMSYAIDLEHFWRVRSGQVLAVALHGAQVTTDEPVVALSEKLVLGGATTLRGFREDQFGGVQIAWANLEYRYLLGRQSRAFAFVDLGYYHDELDTRAQGGGIETTGAGKTGYGVGLRAESRLGILGIDYGLARGDSFSDGKIHVSLINRF